MITVTKGQWFPLTISNIQYGGVDFDLQGATDVKAALVSTTGVRAELGVTISAFNELSAVCDGNMALGKYSVEVTAVGSDGKNYRMRSPLAVLEISSSTSPSNSSKARIQGDNWELTADVEMHEGQARTYMSLLEEARKATLEAKDKADAATGKVIDALALANEAKTTADAQVKTLTDTNVAIEDAEAKRVAAESARAEAETTRQSNEQARKDAESARATAEAARSVAENERQTNEQARQTAEAARMTAENARKDAETARATEESKRVMAETERAKTEKARQTAETARQTAEAQRAAAEAKRVAAESARAEAETTRQSNEQARKDAESARATAEAARSVAENERQTNEQARQTAEAARMTAENARKDAETARATEESKRVMAEAERAKTETARQTAEAQRAAAEAQRAAAYQKMKEGNAATISEMQRVVANITNAQSAAPMTSVPASIYTATELTAAVGETVSVAPSVFMPASCNRSVLYRVISDTGKVRYNGDVILPSDAADVVVEVIPALNNMAARVVTIHAVAPTPILDLAGEEITDERGEAITA